MTNPPVIDAPEEKTIAEALDWAIAHYDAHGHPSDKPYLTAIKRCLFAALPSPAGEQPELLSKRKQCLCTGC